MTYNFDPDAWYERELEAARLRLERGEIDGEQYERQCEQAARQYDQMLASLNSVASY